MEKESEKDLRTLDGRICVGGCSCVDFYTTGTRGSGARGGRNTSGIVYSSISAVKVLGPPNLVVASQNKVRLKHKSTPLVL